MPDKPQKKYHAPALERGLHILEFLAGHQVPLTLQQIALGLDKKSSEVFRMLMILCDCGYIHKLQKNSYILSPKMFQLASRHPPLQRMLALAQPLLQQLTIDIEQSCHISIAYHNDLLVVACYESPYKMGFSLRLGAQIDLFGSGSGNIFLAYCNAETRESLLERNPCSPLEKQQTLQTLPQILAQGYFIGDSPQVDGLTNISVPVFSYEQEIFAILTVPYLHLNATSLHRSVVNIDAVTQMLVPIAAQLSQSLSAKQPLGEMTP